MRKRSIVDIGQDSEYASGRPFFFFHKEREEERDRERVRREEKADEHSFIMSISLFQYFIIENDSTNPVFWKSQNITTGPTSS